ncbi:hypothetical protein STENM327S_06382 [Streptomyces tendae]
MPRRFAGWDESAFDVLLRFEGEPSHEVMRDTRDRERLVRQPMVSLLHDLARADPAFEDHSVWRYGKTPWWWQNQSAVVRIAPNVEIGLRFNLDGLHVQGVVVRRLRSDQPVQIGGRRRGKWFRIGRCRGGIRGKGFKVSGDVLKRAPREYPADHPRTTLLRHRSLLAVRYLGCDERLRTPEVVDRVLATHEELEPLLTWLTDHVAS